MRLVKRDHVPQSAMEEIGEMYELVLVTENTRKGLCKANWACEQIVSRYMKETISSNCLYNT